MPSIDGKSNTTPNTSTSQEATNEQTSSGATSEGRKVSLRENAQKIFNRDNATWLGKGLTRLASIVSKFTSVEPTAYIQRNDNKTGNPQQEGSSVDPSPNNSANTALGSSVDPEPNNTVTTAKSEQPQKPGSSSVPADTRGTLKYSTLSPKEKERKTQQKLEQGNPTGTSGEERRIERFEDLPPLPGTSDQLRDQLERAITTLKTAATQGWNDTFDATTTIRRIAKHNEDLVTPKLNEIIQNLARHTQGNQLKVVSAALVTINELVSSQKTNIRTALEKELKAGQQKSVLTGFIINTLSKKAVKKTVVTTIEHIKNTLFTNNEWITHIVNLAIADMQKLQDKGTQKTSLRLMAKKDTADAVIQQINILNMTPDEKKEAANDLHRLADKNFRMAPPALTKLQSQIKKLEK